MPDSSSQDGDDVRHNPSAKQHHIVPIIYSHSALPAEETAVASNQAVELLKQKLLGTTNDRERAKRLWQEAEHPVLVACQAWKDAILHQDGNGAEEAAQQLVAFLRFNTGYLQRPNFKMPYERLNMRQVLSAENLPALNRLIEVSQG